MADRAAIEQLFASYAWPMDTREWPVLSTVFTDDASFEIIIGGEPAAGPIIGRDEIVEFCTSAVEEQTDQRHHVITNIRLSNETESSADATAVLTLIVIDGGTLEVRSSGVYTTTVVREADGGWRFASLRLELDLAA